MQDVEREHSRAIERTFKSYRENVKELERKKQELDRTSARERTCKSQREHIQN
jgi:hypothetical protein